MKKVHLKALTWKEFGCAPWECWIVSATNFFSSAGLSSIVNLVTCILILLVLLVCFSL